MIEDFDRDLFKKCMPYFDKPPVIFDIGAHEGLYTKFVLQTIPDADCYLFEPNIDLLKDFKNGNIYGFAVSDVSEEQTFYIPPKKNDELASLYKREVFNDTGFITKEATCVTVDLFCISMAISKVDFIKVDVEGAELDVLNGCPSMMRNKQIKFLQVEYGGTYKDAGITFKQVIETAALFGYSVYELVNNELLPVTPINFIEDYRYNVFLLTYIKCS